jgi:hypothetical protein
VQVLCTYHIVEFLEVQPLDGWRPWETASSSITVRRAWGDHPLDGWRPWETALSSSARAHGSQSSEVEPDDTSFRVVRCIRRPHPIPPKREHGSRSRQQEHIGRPWETASSSSARAHSSRSSEVEPYFHVFPLPIV